MPLPLLAIILGVAAALAVVVLAIIYWDDIVNWFRQRNDIKEADEANIAFTINERMATGDYTVVQGVFNKRSETIVEGRKMQTEKLDQQLANAHKDKDLVIYE